MYGLVIEASSRTSLSVFSLSFWSSSPIFIFLRAYSLPSSLSQIIILPFHFPDRRICPFSDPF